MFVSFNGSYLHEWRERDCLKADELKVLFGNIEDVYEFSIILLNELEQSGLDPTKISNCFIRLQDHFNVYTKYWWVILTTKKKPKTIIVILDRALLGTTFIYLLYFIFLKCGETVSVMSHSLTKFQITMADFSPTTHKNCFVHIIIGTITGFDMVKFSFYFYYY